MSHHDWSEKDFDWKGLDDAIDIIVWWSNKIGRFGGQSKEKFGGVRFYCWFSDGTLYGLIKPGYYYYNWPKWFNWIDYEIIARVVRYTGLLWLIHKWQHFIYRAAYKRAVDKHPSLRDEILVDADHHEYLEGIHGFKHSDYWTTYEK